MAMICEFTAPKGRGSVCGVLEEVFSECFGARAPMQSDCRYSYARDPQAECPIAQEILGHFPSGDEEAANAP
jgi:hypothetical protein